MTDSHETWRDSRVPLQVLFTQVSCQTADPMTTYGVFSLESPLLYGGAAVIYEVQHRAMNAAHGSKILTRQTRS